MLLNQLDIIAKPQLRFPDYGDNWKLRRFSDVYRFGRSNSFSRDLLSYDKGNIYNVHYGDIHTKLRSNFTADDEIIPKIKEDFIFDSGDFLEAGDLILADASEDYADIGKTIEIIDTGNKKIVSGLHTILCKRIVNDIALGFPVFLMKSWSVRHKIMIISQGVKVFGLPKDYLANLFLPFPEKNEQQKIASFLTKVDEWIENLKKQKEEWEKYKKGTMQKIFSQKIRFKDENKRSSESWTSHELSDIASIYQPETISQSCLSENGKYLVYGANGIIGKYSKYNHETPQITVTCRGSTCGTINFTKPYSWITGNAMVINTDNYKDINKNFLFHYLTNDDLRYLITGSGQPQITGDIKRHRVKIPSKSEQHKIAEFLTYLDKVIEFKHKQIELAESWKKGLVQRMFV